MQTGNGVFLKNQKIIVIGAGLVGTLGAIMLARRGAAVEIIERQTQEAVRAFSNRRSFNVTISSRGKAALEAAGIWDRVEKQTIPITGRMCHMGELAEAFPYSPDCELALHGARRSDINTELLDAALEAGVKIRFGWTVTDLDKASGAITIAPVSGQQDPEVIEDADFVIGADGVNSVVRRLIHRDERTNFSQRYLDWNYREISIPAGTDPASPWLMDPHSLHIWPRGDLMMFALPNPDGSFTGNFIYPMEKEDDFARRGKIEEVLRTEFPDVLRLVPDAEERLRATPASYFQTQRNSKWFCNDKFVLVGDAAHATVPFYGQGMNSGFESMVELLTQLERFSADERAKAFAVYQANRKPHTDAVADLSIANFEELRSNFRHILPQARRRIDVLLYRMLPRHYIPLHIKISHSVTDYQTAIDECERRDRILRLFGFDLMVLAFAAGNLVITGSKGLCRAVARQRDRFALPSVTHIDHGTVNRDAHLER
jgi:kynurenine 3-monooxygenase